MSAHNLLRYPVVVSSYMRNKKAEQKSDPAIAHRNREIFPGTRSSKSSRPHYALSRQGCPPREQRRRPSEGARALQRPPLLGALFKLACTTHLGCTPRGPCSAGGGDSSRNGKRNGSVRTGVRACLCLYTSLSIPGFLIAMGGRGSEGGSLSVRAAGGGGPTRRRGNGGEEGNRCKALLPRCPTGT